MLVVIKLVCLGFSCVLYDSGEVIVKNWFIVKVVRLRIEVVYEMKYGMWR